MEFYNGNPQDAFPNELDRFRKEMKENNWDLGEDEEELFSLQCTKDSIVTTRAVLPNNVSQQSLRLQGKGNAPIVITRPVVEMPKVDVEKIIAANPNAKPVQSTVKGQLIWQYDIIDKSSAPNIGEKVEANKPMCFVQAFYGLEEIKPAFEGKIVAICAKHGEIVQKGEIIAFVE